MRALNTLVCFVVFSGFLPTAADAGPWRHCREAPDGRILSSRAYDIVGDQAVRVSRGDIRALRDRRSLGDKSVASLEERIDQLETDIRGLNDAINDLADLFEDLRLKLEGQKR